MSFATLTSSAADLLRRTGRWIARHPFIALGSLPLVLVALLAAYVAAMVPLTPAIGDIQKARTEQPSVVLSADGQELTAFKRANREWVKLADISPNVVAALIATEDRRFYDHHGFDLRRTIGAALHTLKGDLQGGSTLTQQLARNLFPEEIGRAPTIERKVKEAITAFKIESVYTKNDILETYLNTVPFLYNAYGIEMAARTYFDKTASDLDVLESATLIGMLKGTSYYNPVLNPQRSLQRRNTVLAVMSRAGKIPPGQLEALSRRPLGLDFERQGEDIGPAPHVAQQLRRWLIEWADRKGYDIQADGLTVRTTLDSKLQAMASDAVTRQADKLQLAADAAWRRGKGWLAHKDLADAFVRESDAYRAAVASGLADADAVKKVEGDADFMRQLWEDKTRLQAGFLAIEPGTGYIRAWVGSRGFDVDKFDHVQQARRQPGSTFKPFVYGAAFEQGISPNQTFIDQPVEIRIDEKTVWRPGDVAAPSGLPMTLRDGLTYSKNSITSQLMQQVGAERVAKLAWDMGVRESKLDQVPSLALGTSPVTLKEMVTAFGTIANGGNYVPPVLVTRVEDRNHRVLEEFHPSPPQRALSERAAQTLLDVMRGVIEKGTGAGVRSRFGLQGDLAGKTGTTQSNTDGWFILMHPQLVGGAWVGFNDNRVTMRGDAWGQGAHNALNIVGDFFQQTVKAKRIDTKARFAAPHEQNLPEILPENPAEIANAPDPLMGRVNDWINGVFGRASPDGAAPQAPLPEPAVAGEASPAAMAPRTVPPAFPEPAAMSQPQWPSSLQRVPEIQRAGEPQRPPELQRAPEPQQRPLEARRAPVPLRIERSGQVVIAAPDAPPPAESGSVGIPILTGPGHPPIAPPAPAPVIVMPAPVERDAATQ